MPTELALPRRARLGTGASQSSRARHATGEPSQLFQSFSRAASEFAFLDGDSILNRSRWPVPPVNPIRPTFPEMPHSGGTSLGARWALGTPSCSMSSLVPTPDAQRTSPAEPVGLAAPDAEDCCLVNAGPAAQAPAHAGPWRELRGPKHEFSTRERTFPNWQAGGAPVFPANGEL